MQLHDRFLGKRIAVIGIGPHGEMLADIRFLAKASALVSVYDLRSESRLQEHVAALRSFGLANHVFGEVPVDDLLDMDLILLSHDYPRDSSFLHGARKKGIDIEYPETLFLKTAPPVTVVGIMGAAGTSTVLSMLAPMLEAACKASGQSCVALDPESGTGILAHLKKLSTGDVAVMKIAPRMQAEISALRWSPQVAVFTTMPPREAYRESPFEIMANQTYNNYVIGSDYIIDAVRTSGFQTKAKMLRTKAAIVPEEWLPNAKNPHDLENAALALQAATALKATGEMAEAALRKWKPLKGRIEYAKKVRGVDFINDSASTDPVSTAIALSHVSRGRNAILIFGGAGHAGDYRELYAAISRFAHAVIVLPGSGTLRERAAIRALEGVAVESAPSLEEAVRLAMDHAAKGDAVIYSPAFEPGGVDASRRERSERFLRAVRAL